MPEIKIGDHAFLTGFIMDIFQTSTLPNEEEDDHLFETADPQQPDIEALCRNDSEFLFHLKD